MPGRAGQCPLCGTAQPVRGRSRPVLGAGTAGLEGLGIVIDAERNRAGRGERRISADESAIEVWVVPTDEELEIARQVAALVE